MKRAVSLSHRNKVQGFAIQGFVPSRCTCYIRKLFFVFSVLGLLLFGDIAESFGGMYYCQDRFGRKFFTNVANESNCTKVRLKGKVISWRGSSRSADPSQYDSTIRSIGRRYNVEPSLIKAIIHTESDFDHRAVSTKGAKGLMQLMPGTARELRVQNVFDPMQNIDGGTRYFRKMLDIFNENLMLSLAAYNAGPNLVKRIGKVPNIRETKRYVKKVLRRYRVYKASM